MGGATDSLSTTSLNTGCWMNGTLHGRSEMRRGVYPVGLQQSDGYNLDFNHFRLWWHSFSVIG